MICFPNAKINLGLHVINKRDDGFHNIETVFLPVGFSDMLECVENKSYSRQQKCVFVSHGLAVSGKVSDNLVVKAYHMLDAAFDLAPVLVHLNKMIPMGAGLGGGSSDAACMIKLLNGLFELKLSMDEMENYAAKLGSDCAFFIRNQSAYLFGKGHELEPFSVNLTGHYLVLVNTGAHSNTALAYKHAQRRDLFDPTNNLKHILKKPVSTWKNGLVNDFEASVFKSIPELHQVKEWLYAQGAEYASMSGSGACMFGLFSEKPKLKGTWKESVVFEEPIKSKNSK